MKENTYMSAEQEIFSEEYVSQFKDFGLSQVDLQRNGINETRNVFEYCLREYLKNSSITLSENEQLLDRVTSEIFAKISLLPWIRWEDMKTVEINSAIMVVTMIDGTRHSVDLVDMWRETFVEPQKVKIHQKTRSEEKELQEVVAKDAFYGGSVVMEYTSGAAVAWLGAAGVISLVGGVGKIFAAKSMLVTLADGTKQRITFKKPYVGTREAFSSSVNRILSLSGLQYDFANKKIYSPSERIWQAARTDFENLKKLDYKNFSKNPDAPKMSEEQFYKWRENLIKKHDSIFQELAEWKIPSEKMAKAFRREIASFVAFFPLFAVEFHKKQTPYYLAEAAAEEVSAAIGAKVGVKIAPWWWKPLWAIAGAISGSFVAQGVAEYLEVNRKKWLYTQEANYKDGRSTSLHYIFSFGLSEWLGVVNDAWRKISGNKNAGGMDIGLDNTAVMLPFFNKKLFTIPEVTLYQDKLNMATNPWDWIQQSKTRDIHEWNRYVDMYKIQLTESINSLLGKYMRNESIFADKTAIKEAGGKEKLLEDALFHMLSGSEGGTVFENERANLILGVMSEIKNNTKIPNSIINDYIAKNVGSMKIDDAFKAERRILNNQKLMELLSWLHQFPHLSKEEIEYFETFPNRMLKNLPLYTNDLEKKMYEKILKRTDVPLEMKGVTVGNAFAVWLDQLVSWKEEKYFLDQLDKNNSKWIEWTL